MNLIFKKGMRIRKSFIFLHCETIQEERRSMFVFLLSSSIIKISQQAILKKGTFLILPKCKKKYILSFSQIFEERKNKNPSSNYSKKVKKYML